MGASLLNADCSFADRLAKTMKRTTYRCALSPREKELVHSVRDAAYKRQNPIASDPAANILHEMYHELSEYWDIMVYLGDYFISTVRIHLGQGERAIFPSLSAFDDVVRPYLRAGGVMIDTTRMAAKSEFAREVPELPYLTIRAAWLAAEHFQGDVILATCRREHQGFYSRGFGFEPLCAPRSSCETNGEALCMALDYRSRKTQVEARYPQFGSTESERRRVFGDFERATASTAPAMSRME